VVGVRLWRGLRGTTCSLAVLAAACSATPAVSLAAHRALAHLLILPACALAAPSKPPIDPATNQPEDPLEVGIQLSGLKWACAGAVRTARQTVKTNLALPGERAILAKGCPDGGVDCAAYRLAFGRVSADQSILPIEHREYDLYVRDYANSFRKLHGPDTSSFRAFPSWAGVMRARSVTQARR
jgi:hypothetical protein